MEKNPKFKADPYNVSNKLIQSSDIINIMKNLNINDVSIIYVNRGPGSFAGIRNSLSTVKAMHLAMKIDYYCYSYQDFQSDEKIKYEKTSLKVSELWAVVQISLREASFTHIT